MQAIQIRYLLFDDVFVIKMSGEIRFFWAIALESVLNKIDSKVSKHIIFDWSDATMIDSTMLGVMLQYVLKDENKNQFLVFKPTIVCANMDLINILSRVGFDSFFDIKESDKRIESSLESYTCVQPSNSDKTILQEYVTHSHDVLSKHQSGADFQRVVTAVNKNENKDIPK